MAEFPKRERGAALLTVLLLVAVMGVVATAALERLAFATRMTGNAGAIDQARAYADAGVEIARLRIGDLLAARPGRTTLQGGWLGASQILPVVGGVATARVTDGGNCFNLNSVVAGESESDLKVRPVAVTQFQGLMQTLGIDERQVQVVASSLADWIDTDTVPQPGGAEDETYGRAATPYRAPNRLMVDASELRAVNGVTPGIYDLLRPWVCALPVNDLSPININTLLPGQAPLLAMLLPGQLRVEQARQMLIRRPANGFSSVVEFWAMLARTGLSPRPEVGQQVKLTTHWFGVEITVDVGGTQVIEKALIDAQSVPVMVVRRHWGDVA